MREYTCNGFKMTVDYDRPISGYPNNSDQDKEPAGIEAAEKAVESAIFDNPVIDDDDLSNIAQSAFDAIVGTDDTGGYTVAAKRIKRVSLDNGSSYMSADDFDYDLLAEWWDRIVQTMDDDAREATHDDLAPCTDKEFLKAYLDRSPYDLVIG